MNSRDYRRLRQRRRAAWIEANRNRKHPDAEAEQLIEFASMWAPFGGATAEEIHVRFGMTKRRFIERLWQVIAESKCAEEEVLNLARVYPHLRETNGSSFVRRPIAQGAEDSIDPENL